MMVMDDERMKVLKMVQEGKINADEAAQLLEALDVSSGTKNAKGTTFTTTSSSSNSGSRWMRVLVTDTDTGKTRVNMRVPLSVVSAGIKLGMRFSPEVEGVDPQEIIRAIESGENGLIVDVVDNKDGEHVEIYID